MPDPPFSLQRLEVGRDPDRTRLRHLFFADHHAENLANIRRILVHGLAAAALFLCLVEWLPSPALRGPLMAACVTTGIVAILVGFAELFWRRRRAQLASDLSER